VVAASLIVGGLVAPGWTRALRPARVPGNGLGVVMPCSEEVEIKQRRIQAKGQVVDRLLAGDLSLVQAAAWFRFLDDQPEDWPDDFRRRMPGRGDGDKACRQVISWVRIRLTGRLVRSQGAAAVDRLENELNVLLAENDDVELPW
jgi:hypothetical protein